MTATVTHCHGSVPFGGVLFRVLRLRQPLCVLTSPILSDVGSSFLSASRTESGSLSSPPCSGARVLRPPRLPDALSGSLLFWTPGGGMLFCGGLSVQVARLQCVQRPLGSAPTPPVFCARSLPPRFSRDFSPSSVFLDACLSHQRLRLVVRLRAGWGSRELGFAGGALGAPASRCRGRGAAACLFL